MERMEEISREWLNCHQSDHPCSTVIRKDDDLLFTIYKEDQATLFSVSCPDTEEGKWTVWSEDVDLQPHLASILEYCDSERKKTIPEILDKVDAAICLALKDNKSAEDIGEDEDDDDSNDDYYAYDDDPDVEIKAEAKSNTPDSENSDEKEDGRFFGGNANPAASQRLVKDLKNMKKEAPKFGIEGSPRGDNLFIWDVKLTGFSTDTILGKDIRNWAEKHKREPVVYLEMQFPGDYPMAPPFVRVTRPRFKCLTGHVTIGGSICMEMLTKSGWMPTNDIESILVQIRSEIMSDPNTGLDQNPDSEYEETEARNAFERMVNEYGWNM